MGRLDDLSGLSKDELVLITKLAEQCERYDEMTQFVRHFMSKISSDPSQEEKNLFRPHL
jgi:hypothetical protein